MTCNFLNLTNGLEWMPDIVPPHNFIRIQSTACEQKRWWFLIEDLDYHFLIRAAAGDHCVVFDCSQKKSESRAIYQGLEWIRYVLNRFWLGHIIRPSVRGNYCGDYFESMWTERTIRATKKLEYAKRFLCTDSIIIEGRCRSTQNDGKDEFYREFIGDNGAIDQR